MPLHPEKLTFYDTTLRDGAQARGVDFTVADKLAIARALDAFGIDYIEGGFPGANPNDDAFFAQSPALSHATLTAFGMTRRAGRSAENDPALTATLEAKAGAVCLVGKTSRRQVENSLGVDAEENRRMIAESIAHAKAKGREALFDAEHFFDGYKENPEFALAMAEAAYHAGARWVVLCDTNGGTLPHEVFDIVQAVALRIPGSHLGIHCHNDTENAVANSLAAVRAGVRQVQGTIGGVGERCGNANLLSLIPTLLLKMGYCSRIKPEALSQLTSLAHLLDERLNRAGNPHAAYVGSAAFAHKGGLHASAMAKDTTSYEHIDPATVGNTRTILVSDKSGRANIVDRLKAFGLHNVQDEASISSLVSEVKQREQQGYAYEGAEASFELLCRRTLGKVPKFFDVMGFRVMGERRYNAKGALINVSEATIKLQVAGEQRMTVAEGNGPVNALDGALRAALLPLFPKLESMRLTDYKVRILTPQEGTKALTRVLIESRDEATGRVWSTIGVSGNVIDASFNALEDAVVYMLLKGA